MMLRSLKMKTDMMLMPQWHAFDNAAAQRPSNTTCAKYQANYNEERRQPATFHHEYIMSKNSKTTAKWQQWLAGHHIRQHRSLRFLGRRLHEPNLWRFNRYSVSMGAAIGIYWCFMPMPMQMVAGAIAGLILRANLALAIGLVWISNPITMGPMMYGCYKFGQYLLGSASLNFATENWQDWVAQFHLIWKPLLLGSVTCGLIGGFLVFIVIQLLWHWVQQMAPEQYDDTDIT